MKYLMLAFLLVSGIRSFGQFTKGDKVLGGSFYLSSYSNSFDNKEQYKNSYLSITPTFGVMITKNIEVGGLLNYGYQMQKDVNASSSNRNSFSPGIYAQRYFTVTEKFLFSLMGETSYNVSKGTTRYNTGSDAKSEHKNSSIQINFEPGLIFFPIPKLAIKGSLGDIGYSHSWSTTDNTKGNAFSTSFGNISLGILYYLRTKAE